METLVVLLVLLTLTAAGVRYRGVIEKWLLGSKFDFRKRRTRQIKELRRCIEDDKEELAELEEEAKTKTETGK